jgi:hypothetical protein
MVISYLRRGQFANKLVFIGDNEFERNFNSLSQAKAVKNVNWQLFCHHHAKLFRSDGNIR